MQRRQNKNNFVPTAHNEAQNITSFQEQAPRDAGSKYATQQENVSLTNSNRSCASWKLQQANCHKEHLGIHKQCSTYRESWLMKPTPNTHGLDHRIWPLAHPELAVCDSVFFPPSATDPDQSSLETSHPIIPRVPPGVVGAAGTGTFHEFPPSGIAPQGHRCTWFGPLLRTICPAQPWIAANTLCHSARNFNLHRRL